MKYKIANNGIQVLKSEDDKNAYTSHCELDIIYNESDYKFCMGECELEDCEGKYHKYTTNPTQVEQEIIVGYYENGDAIYETVMVNVDAYTYLTVEGDYISIEEYKTSTIIPEQPSENDVMITTLADTTINLLIKQNDIDTRLQTLEGGGD